MECELPLCALCTISLSNMRYRILFFLLFLLPAIVMGHTREVHLTLTLREAPPRPITLFFLMSGIETPIMKSEIDASGRYQFSFRYQAGFYRLSYGEREWNLTFPLFTPLSSLGDLHINTSGTAPLESAVTTGALEIELYLSARKARAAYQEALWGIEALARAELSDDLLQKLKEENRNLYTERINGLIKRADSAASPITGQILRLFLRPNGNEVATWWDTPLLSTSLVGKSPEFDGYLRDFLQAQHSDSLTYWEQVNAYSRAIHALTQIPIASDNSVVLRNSLDFIVQGGAYEVLLDSIASYFPSHKENPIYTKNSDRKTERLVNLRGTLLDDRKIFVVSRDADYTLLVVWSVWCAHCQEILPQLVRVCEQLPKSLISIRAICIDKDTPAVRHFINSRIWPWENIIETDDGESAILSYLQADGTPELFILDAHGELLSRPEDAQRLERDLKMLKTLKALQGKLL